VQFVEQVALVDGQVGDVATVYADAIRTREQYSPQNTPEEEVGLRVVRHSEHDSEYPYDAAARDHEQHKSCSSQAPNGEDDCHLLLGNAYGQGLLGGVCLCTHYVSKL
jgi:hypothetical protein